MIETDPKPPRASQKLSSHKIVQERVLSEVNPALDRRRDGSSGDAAIETDERTIVVASLPTKLIDPDYVKFEFYNSFNYSMLSDTKKNVRLSMGIGSANQGEGKTLTASNLATSLTLGFQKNTILIDCNLHAPHLHEVFGTPLGPGLYDALEGSPIQIFPTKIQHLFILPAGETGSGSEREKFRIGVEHTAAFGAVIRALEEEFQFIIADMPAISTGSFPVLFLNYLNGLLIVIEVGKTRRQDIDKIFRTVNKNQVLGFVFNRMPDE